MANKKTVDHTKLYPPLEAIALAQSSATNAFDGKIEAHAVVIKTGKFGPYKTERKSPLLHIVLGKQSEKPETLAAELEQFVKTVGSATTIKKLVVCATMGPGVKVDVTSSFQK